MGDALTACHCPHPLAQCQAAQESEHRDALASARTQIGRLETEVSGLEKMLKSKGAYAEHQQLELDSLKDALAKASNERDDVQKDMLDAQARFEVTFSRSSLIEDQTALVSNAVP